MEKIIEYNYAPETCNVIGLKHHRHSPFEKSLMERVNQYFKIELKDLMITIPVF
ncbi:MAG: hypothetical protein ACXWFB_10055 [Nitrososphaeraceae archaeon]